MNKKTIIAIFALMFYNNLEMKKLSLMIITLSFLMTTSYAQKSKGYPQPFKYEGVDTVKNTSKDELFNRALDWVHNSFITEHVIQRINRKEGSISINGTINTLTCHYVVFSVRLYFKDDRYKYVFDDFYEKNNCDVQMADGGSLSNQKPNGDFWTGHLRKGYFNKIKEDINKKILITIGNLKAYMNVPSEKDNW